VADEDSRVPDAATSRQPGWREVIGLAAILVAVVLGAAILTSVLPTGIQELVFHTPLAIIVLIVGTAWLLWRISRRTGSAER
jgi:FtsH-binding integral membrane protein